MGDYIRRQAAIDAIEKHIRVGDEIYPITHDDRVFNWGFEVSASCVYNLPSADVQPVRHGRFIGTEYDGYADGSPVYYEWKCSECGCIFEDEEPTFNYCPNCGARMDGEQND